MTFTTENTELHKEINDISYSIIGCAIKVHSELGPGLLESTYEVCLEKELLDLNYKVERQKELPVVYRDIKLEAGYRVDLLIEDKVIVELKSVEEIHPIHQAQILTYMKLAKKSLGLLINFNVKILKNGVSRFIL